MGRGDTDGRPEIRVGPLILDSSSLELILLRQLPVTWEPLGVSEIPADIEKGHEKVRQSIAPAIENGIQILPVSHDKFLAAWSISQDLIDAGLQTASRFKEGTHLVLRAYTLPVDADRSHFSNSWNDYSIDGSANNSQFKLPKSAARIKVVLGVINKSGHFSPLLRGEPVNLPAPPPAPPPNKKLCPAIKPFKASGN